MFINALVACSHTLVSHTFVFSLKTLLVFPVIRSYNQELRLLIFILSFSFPEWKQYRKVGICVVIYNIIYHTLAYIDQEIPYSFFEGSSGKIVSLYAPPNSLPPLHTKITHTNVLLGLE